MIAGRVMPDGNVAPRRAAVARPAGGISPFVVLVLMHASGILDSLGMFLLPARAETFLLSASRAVWLWLYLYAGFALFRHGAESLMFVKGRTILATVLLVALLSSLWSLDPSLTVQRFVHLLGTTLIGIYIGSCFDARRLFSSLFLAFAVIVIAGALAAFAVPQFGVMNYEGEGAWKGLQLEKNAFGFAATVSVLLSLCRLQALPYLASGEWCERRQAAEDADQEAVRLALHQRRR
jgi:hypothetical protein